MEEEKRGEGRMWSEGSIIMRVKGEREEREGEGHLGKARK